VHFGICTASPRSSVVINLRFTAFHNVYHENDKIITIHKNLLARTRQKDIGFHIYSIVPPMRYGCATLFYNVHAQTRLKIF
jgi:hypothetical protein